MKVNIPPESLSTLQRLQIEGREMAIELDPPVRGIDLSLSSPNLNDLDSDTQRLRHALAASGFPSLWIEFPLLGELSDILRSENWQVRVVLNGDEVVAVLPAGSGIFGFAVDIGTTKLAGYLVDFSSGETIGKNGRMNPQIAYGEDVISRIAFSREGVENRELLQRALIEALNEMLAELCLLAGIRNEQVVQAVIVGNTAMHHLFAGLPVR